MINNKICRFWLELLLSKLLPKAACIRALSDFADVLLTFCETAVFFVRYSETNDIDDLLT